MRRPEIIAKISGENHHMKTPENRQRMKKNNPAKNPKVGKKISDSLKALGANHPSKRPEFRKAMAEKQLAKGDNHPWKQPEFCKSQSERMTKEMLNGKAAYMQSCNQTPSKPQVRLFELIKLFYPKAVLNYPSLNRSIDIAIPDLMIAIEYDGSYWHQDQKADEKRQEELESIGWRFLRYCDYIPSVEELKRDLCPRREKE